MGARHGLPKGGLKVEGHYQMGDSRKLTFAAPVSMGTESTWAMALASEFYKADLASATIHIKFSIALSLFRWRRRYQFAQSSKEIHFHIPFTEPMTNADLMTRNHLGRAVRAFCISFTIPSIKFYFYYQSRQYCNNTLKENEAISSAVGCASSTWDTKLDHPRYFRRVLVFEKHICTSVKSTSTTFLISADFVTSDHFHALLCSTRDILLLVTTRLGRGSYGCSEQLLDSPHLAVWNSAKGISKNETIPKNHGRCGSV